MGLRKKLQGLIIGHKDFVGSNSSFKSVILCGQMALVAYLVGLAFIIIDALSRVKAFIPFYLVLMVVAVIVLALLRSGLYRQGKVTLLIAANLLIYIFVSNDSFQAGAYIYFIITPLMSLSLFGFNERKTALTFCVLSLLLFVIAYFGGFKIITFSDAEMNILHDENYTRISFLSNFIIGLFVSVLVFYFLLDINQYSEKLILTKNDELAKTNEELDRFVYSASHDLRAPLSSLIGLIGVARQSQTKEELEQCFSMMKGRVQTLDKFIGEIIDYSRNSRQEVEQVNINVVTLCRETVDALKFTQAHEFFVTYVIPEDLNVMSDITRVKIILNNIIGNAMKYYDRSKLAHQIDIMAIKDGRSMVIEITDNGVGIPPEHHQRIFDMFYRASESSHGSGLGLYIVKEALAKLKGEIRFISAPGVGTTFIITLPA